MTVELVVVPEVLMPNPAEVQDYLAAHPDMVDLVESVTATRPAPRPPRGSTTREVPSHIRCPARPLLCARAPGACALQRGRTPQEVCSQGERPPAEKHRTAGLYALGTGDDEPNP